jgi:hypothetical protein
LGEGRFAHGAIDTLPHPGNPFHLVVFRQTRLPEPQEESVTSPPLEMSVNGTATPEILRQRLPLAACTQNINDGGKDLPRDDRLAPATRAPLIIALLPTLPWIVLHQERFRLGPEFIRNFPRLDFRHSRNPI